MHADVVVVGLGAMGSSVLYQLTRVGHTAIGIDRHDPPHAFGSSHGETRITRLAVGEGAEFVPLVAKSHAIWRELERETGETLLVECGALMIGSDAMANLHHGKADFVRRTIAIAEANAIAHDVLNATEIRRRFPSLIGVGEGDIGYLEPSAGYVFPERIIASELNLAQAGGARILTGTQVLSVAHGADGVRVETTGGTVTAGRAIVAAGTWTGPLLGGIYDETLSVRRQILHWFETEPDRRDALRELPVVIWQHGPEADDFFYSFPVLPGQTSFKAATEQQAETCAPDLLDRTIRPGEANALFARHLQGRIRGVRTTAERSAVCAYAVTPDHGFIIDRHPEHDRIHVIAACSGHGFKHSGGIGHAVVTALEGSVGMDAAFAIDRFR